MKLASFFTNFHGEYFGLEAVTKSSCHNIFLITKNKALLLINFLKKDIWHESLNLFDMIFSVSDKTQMQ